MLLLTTTYHAAWVDCLEYSLLTTHHSSLTTLLNNHHSSYNRHSSQQPPLISTTTTHHDNHHSLLTTHYSLLTSPLLTAFQELARLIGHQNLKQKIQHHVKIKEENNGLKQADPIQIPSGSYLASA